MWVGSISHFFFFTRCHRIHIFVVQRTNTSRLTHSPTLLLSFWWICDDCGTHSFTQNDGGKSWYNPRHRKWLWHDNKIVRSIFSCANLLQTHRHQHVYHWSCDADSAGIRSVSMRCEREKNIFCLFVIFVCVQACAPTGCWMMMIVVWEYTNYEKLMGYFVT